MSSSINLSQSVRDFLHELALQLNKKPQDMDNFVKIFEDNWFDTVESLTTISEEQWSQLKLPMALVNAIKKKVSQPPQPLPIQTQVSQDVTMIDTSIQQQVPIVPPNRHQLNEQLEEAKATEIKEQCFAALQDLYAMEQSSSIGGSSSQAIHRDTVKTLFTIVANLIAQPLEPQVRRLNKTNKAVQSKVLQYQNACRFLRHIGFDFESNPQQVELKDYRKDYLEAAQLALNAHVASLGGQVEGGEKFDPFKSSVSSTTYNKKPPVQAKQGDIDVYDPNAVALEIQKIQEQRMKALKDIQVASRDIKVFNIQHTGQNLKSYLMDLDKKEQERLAQLKIDEDKLDESIQNTSVLKFLAEVEKAQKFKNKRMEELEKMLKQQVYTTTLIRIRFPDDYVIQGTFGSLEKVEDIYAFIKDNLFVQGREFYLYETPPKKIVSDMKSSLKKARLVPSGMLYFGWTDLDQTKSSDGPFLDIAKLKEKIIAF